MKENEEQTFSQDQCLRCTCGQISECGTTPPCLNVHDLFQTFVEINSPSQ